MNILITGSQGYVGSILCQKLMDLNNSDFAIYGIDNLSNVRELKHSDKIKVLSTANLFSRAIRNTHEHRSISALFVEG